MGANLQPHNSFCAQNPHELKDQAFCEDEELYMSEASEGTAVDYDSQAEAAGEQSKAGRGFSNLNKTKMTTAAPTGLLQSQNGAE